MSREKSKNTILIFSLLVLIITSVIVSVGLGPTKISYKQIISIIIQTIVQGSNMANSFSDIILTIRLPRTILSVAAGAALAVSGTVMQAVVKNPLADPYILGISSGASLGATVAIMLGVGSSFGNQFVGITSFVGALFVATLILVFARITKSTDVTRLLLIGVALNLLCSALSSFVIFLAPNAQGMMTLNFWLMGSIAGATWGQVILLLPLIIVAVLFFMIRSRILNVMLLSDDEAITLGQNLDIERVIDIVFVSVLVGFTVYACGIIGFVGLLVPHITRLLFGSNHRVVVPISALIGALTLLWADILSRTLISGSEIPIGIIVSSIGAPFFLYIIVHSNKFK